MNVLVTGANGTIGTALRDHLGDDPGYEFTWLDVEEHPEYETTVADTRDYDALRAAAEGQDAIVHLALSDYLGGSTSRELGWEEGFSGSFAEVCNVYAAARDAGAESVVFASSNHAVGMYEVELAPDIYEPDVELTVDHTVPPRPDSRYGALKVFGEGMGRLASEAHGLSVYCLRIGAVRDPEYDHPYGDAERGVDRGDWERGDPAYDEQVARLSSLWLSRRDCAQLVDRCLRDDDVDFEIVSGISESDRAWLDLEHAREVLGYVPEDDAGEWDGPPESA